MKTIKYEEMNKDIKLYKIGFKPRFEVYAVLVFGILLALVPNMFIRIVGAVFILISIVAKFMIKDHTVAALSDKEVFVYHEDDIDVIDFDEIDTWLVRSTDTRMGGIGFALKDGSNVTVMTFQAEKFRVALNKVLRHKEYSEKFANERPNNGGLIKRTMFLIKHYFSGSKNK